MDKLQRTFPLLYKLYLKIAEPRVVRLLHFGIYICLLVAGIGVIFHPPRSFEGSLGILLVLMFGGMLFLGALIAAVSVLPGVWWLERVGLILLATGLLIYTVTMISLNASPVTLSIPIGFILTLVLRWLEIRRYQLAPRKG